MFKARSSLPLFKRYNIRSGNASMAVSTMVGTGTKMTQFGILAFLEALEIDLRGNLPGSKCDEYCIFLWELFFVLQKSFFPSWPCSFFKIFLNQSPVMFLTDLDK